MMKKTLLDPSRAEWSGTTETERRHGWVAVLLAHEDLRIRATRPMIGFYGATRTEEEMMEHLRALVAYFHETHGLKNVPFRAIKVDWQDFHALCRTSEDQDSAEARQVIMDGIIHGVLMREARSVLGMNRRRMADTLDDEGAKVTEQREQLRQLIQPKLTAWEARLEEEGVKQPSEAASVDEGPLGVDHFSISTADRVKWNLSSGAHSVAIASFLSDERSPQMAYVACSVHSEPESDMVRFLRDTMGPRFTNTVKITPVVMWKLLDVMRLHQVVDGVSTHYSESDVAAATKSTGGTTA